MNPARLSFLLGILSVLAPSTCLPASMPDLVPIKLEAPSLVTDAPRPDVLVSWAVTNQGNLGVNYWVDLLYLSTNAIYDASASYVGQFGAPWPLYPGDYYEQSKIVPLPIYTNGTYHLFVVVDGWNYAAESVESNNVLSTSFEFVARPPDLAPIAFIVPSELVTNSDPYVSVVWAVTNQGIGPASRPWSGTVTFSTKSTPEPSDLWLASYPVSEVLPAGGILWRTNAVQLPVNENGTYYLFLRVGWDDSLLESNVSNNVQMATVKVTVVKPDLAPIYLAVNSSTVNVSVNPAVTLVWGVTNQGAGPVGQSQFLADGVYFSQDAVLDGLDNLLNYVWQEGPVFSGGSYWRTNTLAVPVVTNGTYYLILLADAFHWIGEESESNNQIAIPVTFTLNHPDLVALAAGVPAAITGAPNPVLKLNWGITNQGTAPATGYGYDRVLFSTRSTLDSSAVEIARAYRWQPVPVGSTVWFANDVQLPATQNGDYFIFVVADTGNVGIDLDPANNTLAVPIHVEIVPPDLVALGFQVTSNYTGSANPNLKMSWRVENRGAGSTGSGNSWVDSVFLSPDALLDASDTEIFSTRESGAVAPGGVYARTNLVQIPKSGSGNYYLFFVTDSRSELMESDNGNNRLMVPMHLTIRQPDLLPLVFNTSASITGAPNPMVTLVWGVTNQGAGDAQSYWNDTVWFSKDRTISQDDIMVVDLANYYPLRAAESVSHTNQVQLPCASNGTYYLIFQANRNWQVTESDQSNNALVFPFEFHSVLPDLAPVAFQVPPVVSAPPNPSVAVSWCVTNGGPGEARSPNQWSPWYDRLYLSRDGILDDQDLPLGSYYDFAGRTYLAPGDSYGFTNVTVQLPLQEDGDYYLIFATDWFRTIAETNEANNTIAAPFRYEMRRSDLATLLVNVPQRVTGPPNPRIDVTWAVTNQGPIEAEANYSWSDGVFFSKAPFYDSQDQNLAVNYLTTPLPSGGVVWYTNSVRPPVMKSGTAYLSFKTDMNNSVPESNENNNVVTVPVEFTVLMPDLVPGRLQLTSGLTVTPRPVITVKWAVTNQGPVEADWEWTERVTLSTNPLPSANDPTLGTASDLQPIAAGGVVWRTITAQADIVQSGTYYITVRVNEYHPLIESDYDNNILTVPVYIQVLPPDLIPVVTVPTEVVGPPNPRLTVRWGVTNAGPGEIKGSWMDAVYFSRDANYDPSDSLITYTWRYGLAAGAAQWNTTELRLPCIETGDYFLIFRANQDGYQYESNLQNNTLVLPIHLHIDRPDLVVSVDPLPNHVVCSPKPRLAMSWKVQNAGLGEADYRMDALYLTTNGEVDNDSQILQYFYYSTPLAPGAANTSQLNPILPVVDSGRYYLIFAADVQNTLLETDESNNRVAVPVDFEVLRPDLSPTALLVPGQVTGPPNPAVTLIYGVTNNGPGNVEEGSWSDALYISTNSFFDVTATLVQSFSHSRTVASGETYWSTNSVRLPVTASGKYYLFLKLDHYGALIESLTGNNQIATSLDLNVLPPDLMPVTLTATNGVLSAPNPSVQVVWGITNRGVGPALGGWLDELFFSGKPQFDDSATRVGSHWENLESSPGEVYWRTETISLPVSTTGDYFLHLRVNSRRELFESDFSNNGTSIPLHLDIDFPDLVPIALQVTNLVIGTQNPTVRVTWAITNQAEVPALSSWTWTDGLYLSTDAVLDSSDALLLERYQEHPVTARSSYWRQEWLTLPVKESGQFFLILSTDSRSRLAESNDANNTLAMPITVHIDPPDLAPFTMIVPNVVTGSPGTSVRLVVGVTNQGVGPAVSDWWDSVFLSRDATLDSNEDYRLIYLYRYNPAPVPAGGFYWSTNYFQLPAAMMPTDPDQPANLFLIVGVNESGQLKESNTANNSMAVPIQLVLEPPPDLALLDLKLLNVVPGTPDPLATVVWGVTNQGAGTASFWMDGLYIATNSVLNPGDFYRGVDSWYALLPLAPGGSYWRTNTVMIPAAESGPRYLVMVTDSGEQSRDPVRTNNSLAIPINLQVDLPDLAVTSLLVPPVVSGPCYPKVSIAWAVTNLGPGSAQGREWMDVLFLSDSPDYRPPWPFDGVSGHLPSGTNAYWSTNLFTLPVDHSGVYYLTLKTAEYGYVTESNPTNDLLTVPILYNRVDPDLMPTTLIAPQKLIGPPHPEITVVTCVTNLSPMAFDGVWQQYLYFSRTGLRDGSEQLINILETVGIAGLGTSWATNTVQLPMTESVDGYLMLVMSPFLDSCQASFTSPVLIKPISVTVRPSDIAIAAFLVPPVVKGVPYPELTVVTCLTNLGTGSITGDRTDMLYLSATPFTDQWSIAALGQARADLIPPGGSLWLTNTFHLPVADGGDYYLIYRADSYDSIPESSELNNQAVAPIRLDLSLLPQLVIRSFSVPQVVTGPAYPSIEVSWVAENQGLGLSLGPWYDTVGLDGADMQTTLLASYAQTNSLLVGESYERTQPLTLPISVSGDYSLILTVNAPEFSPGVPGSADARSLSFRYIRTHELELTLSADGYGPGGFRLSVRAALGRSYRLMASSDLLHWDRVFDFYCTNTLMQFVDPAASSHAQRFYQVVESFLPEPLQLTLALGSAPTDGISLLLDGPPAPRYRIEASSDLQTWTMLTEVTTATTPIECRDVAPVEGQRFYRAVRVQN